MRRAALLVLGVLVMGVASPALGWEFSLKGDLEVRYRYFLRTGGGDLFGKANPDAIGYNDGAIGFAGYYGGLNQVAAQGYSAKSADAAVNDNRIVLRPDFWVNSAVHIRGEYWVTGGNIFGSYDGAGAAPIGTMGGDSWIRNRGYTGWYNNPAYTIPTGMATGVWDKFWATVETPWGILALGRRPLAFGLGWSTMHQKDADTEMLGLFVPYGPFTFLVVTQLFENNWIIPNHSYQLASTEVGGFNPPGVAAATDKTGIRDINGSIGVTYKSGGVDMGTVSRYVYHNEVHAYAPTGPTYKPTAPVPAGPNRRDDASLSPIPIWFSGTGLSGFPTYSDIGWLLQVSYFKYTNGRFFLNTEYSFENINVRRKGGRPLSGFQNAWMVELGAICGPTKLSLANFYHSGHDRRGGVFNTTAATGFATGAYVMDRFDEFTIFGGCYEPSKPYNYLIGIYGGGNNGYEVRGLAFYNDFLAYAARLDYAVAANLNTFVTFMQANRASNTATAVGQYRGGTPNAGARANPGYNAAGVQIAPIPNVPDNNLGYEIDAGVNWKILENVTFNALGAFWQPGDWFKWAYVDYTGPTSATINGVAYPVNPHRGIDPIFGFQGSFLVDF